MTQSLIDWTEEELGEQDDHVLAPLPVATRTQPGDVWQVGRHTLYCADSEESDHVHRLVNNHGYATLVFTDPPYQMDTLHRSKSPFLDMTERVGGMSQAYGAITEMGIGQFDPGCFLSLLPNYFKPGTMAAYIFHSKDSAPDYGGWVRDQRQGTSDLVIEKDGRASIVHHGLKGMSCTPLVWHKVSDQTGKANPIPFGKAHHADVEYLLYLRLRGKWNNKDKAPLAHRGRVLCYPKQVGVGQFPCAKPVALIVNQLLLTTDPDDVVVDPYGGSGSTLLACEETGRRCVMTERLPRLCDLTISRWEGLSGRAATKIE